MSGAIAGTAILNTKPEEKLQTITLTVNNKCNLKCSHCYLQDDDTGFVDSEILNKVIKSTAKHIVIVGKEPLADIEKTSQTIQLLNENGKQVSMVTNGINLHKMDRNILKMLKYIDISMDGGPKTYSRSNYETILKNLELHPNTNILHTIYNENLENINDMLEVPHKIMMFSPYLITDNKGINTVTPASLKKIIKAFSKSKIKEYPNAYLMIDTYHLEQDKLTVSELETQIKEVGLEQNIILIKQDALEHGIVRVTHNGKILTPSDSLHTQRYDFTGREVGNIDEQYKEFCSVGV
ncbi:MAG: radical SAM protein [Nanoarchaeota archaeon]|nr:radical SAM protein [Nanoarchaeota archaeon]MBU1322021.1 radical SAM protein [Nanoarchaeota archaeon]MBU1598106.1 radical SAM protein [Nanoarchaeota archaeon]MBU2441765.1 radical SAM protein [Nanoarchaeota archaeon]